MECISYAKGFGWGAELTLTNIFESLFKEEFGKGYPRERAIPEQTNKRILDEVRSVTMQDMLTILKNIDQDFLKNTINNDYFKENFFENSKNDEISEYLKSLLNI